MNVLCANCHHFGPSLRVSNADRDDFRDRGVPSDYAYKVVCSECLSPRVTETPACAACEQRPVQVPGTDHCFTCHNQRTLDQLAVVTRFMKAVGS